MPATQRGRHRHSSAPHCGQAGTVAQIGAVPERAAAIGNADGCDIQATVDIVFAFEHEQDMGRLSR
jgi:hypothetical protein